MLINYAWITEKRRKMEKENNLEQLIYVTHILPTQPKPQYWPYWIQVVFLTQQEGNEYYQIGYGFGRSVDPQEIKEAEAIGEVVPLAEKYPIQKSESVWRHKKELYIADVNDPIGDPKKRKIQTWTKNGAKSNEPRNTF